MSAQGLVYTFNISNATLGTASTDIWTLGTSAAVPVLIHEIRLTGNQTVDTRLSLQILRRTTGPTGGSTITPRPLNKRNTVAAASTITTLPGTPGAAGDILEAEIWSELVPYSRIFTPDERILVPVSSWVSLFLTTTLVAINASAVVYFEEI